MKMFYIKERDNPQTGTYYVAKGQMTKKDAKQAENSLYGSNTMLAFATKEEYDAKLAALKAAGERVQ